jgi:hypothetical protein
MDFDKYCRQRKIEYLYNENDELLGKIRYFFTNNNEKYFSKEEIFQQFVNDFKDAFEADAVIKHLFVCEEKLCMTYFPDNKIYKYKYLQKKDNQTPLKT